MLHACFQGYQNLYTLEGGVHAYLRWQREAGAAAEAEQERAGPLWNGSLFVFDNRLAIPPPGERPTACASQLRMRAPAPPARLSMLAQTHAGWSLSREHACRLHAQLTILTGQVGFRVQHLSWLI